MVRRNLPETFVVFTKEGIFNSCLLKHDVKLLVFFKQILIIVDKNYPTAKVFQQGALNIQ